MYCMSSSLAFLTISGFNGNPVLGCVTLEWDGRDGRQLPRKPCSHLRLVLLCQLSPSFETFAVSSQDHDVERCALADHEHHPTELSRRRRSFSFRIVPFGIGATAFAASSINFCRRGIAAPAYPLNTVLQSRHASYAPEKSLGLPQQTRIHTDSHRLRPMQWSTSDFLSECCKLVRCLLSALIQLIVQFCVLPGQTLQRSRELLMHCSHGVFGHLGLSGTRAFQPTRINQLEFQLGGVQASRSSTNHDGFPTLARIPT